MSEFLDYDPDTGMRYDMESDGKGELKIYSSEDVEPLLEHTKRIRNKNDNSGIKREFWKYCSIPTSVYLELRKKGIDMYNKNHTKAFMREINQNYPHLKYTTLHHE